MKKFEEYVEEFSTPPYYETADPETADKYKQADYGAVHAVWVCFFAINALFGYHEVFGNLCRKELAYAVLCTKEVIKYLESLGNEEWNIKNIKDCFDACITPLNWTIVEEDRTEADIDRYLTWYSESGDSSIHKSIANFIEFLK